MISIVLPTYNEVENIEPMIKKVESVFKKNSLKGEILVVDDKSPDDTAGKALELNKRFGNIRVITPEKREGAGKAHKIGYDHAKGDIIIAMEADLSCDVGDIPVLVDKINEGYDLVVASRYAKDGSTDKPLKNIILSKYGNKFISFISGIKVTDFTIAYRAFRKEINSSIKPLEKDGNPFLMEFVLKAGKKGFKIGEIGTKYTHRAKGVTKNRLFWATLRTFKAAIRITLFGK